MDAGTLDGGPDALSAARARELGERARRLEREARAVMADLDIGRVLGRRGEVFHVGSSSAGVMVSRDVDLYVVAAAWSPAACWEALGPLFAQERLQSIRLSKWLGAHAAPDLPEGYSAVLRYYTPAREQWRLDLWFFTGGGAEGPLARHAELLGGLNPETRRAILWIKDAHHTSPSYRSVDVYDAVLRGGVRTPADFARWLAARGRA